MSKSIPSASDLIRDRRCEVCGEVLCLHRVARGVCEAGQCQRVWAQRKLGQERRREQQRQQRQQEQRAQAREILQRQSGAGGKMSLPIVLVPANTRPLTLLPDQRRQRFAEHLRSVAEAFFEGERASPAPESLEGSGGERTKCSEAPDEPARQVLGEACATCGGRCCLEGGEHAYLDQQSVRDYVQQHPGATVDSLLADYLSRIPPITYQDSCVFHAEDGCALPREMRSAEARRFFCEGLDEFRQQMQQSPQRECFVAAVKEDRIVRTRRIRPEPRE